MRVCKAVVAIVCAGCAPIHSFQSTTNTNLRPVIEHQVVNGSLEFSLSTEVNGHRISFDIEQQETCATLTTPRTHRRRYVDRRVDPTASGTTWAIAILATAAGVYGVLNADRLAVQSNTSGSPSPDQYRQYAGGLLVIGGTAAAIGVIDGIRATDSRHDDGVIESETTRVEATCRRRATINREVELRLANGQRLAGRSDGNGRVTFDFAEVPEEGLPGDNTRQYVAIGDAQLSVDLSQDQRATIRSSLMADPTTRLAIDILQKRRDACAKAVDQVRTSLRPPPSDVSRDALASWSSVKASCGDVWTVAFEDELKVVKVRVVDTECRSSLRAVDEAFENGGEIEIEKVTAELASLRDTCKAPDHVSKLEQLDSKLASTIKRIEREALAEARRLERERQALRKEIERARTQRSVPAPTWPTAPSRSCCKICSRGKACGNTCISRSKTCHVGVGCACDG